MMTMWGWKLAFENFDQVWEVTNLIFLVELNSKISEKKTTQIKIKPVNWSENGNEQASQP